MPGSASQIPHSFGCGFGVGVGATSSAAMSGLLACAVVLSVVVSLVSLFADEESPASTCCRVTSESGTLSCSSGIDMATTAASIWCFASVGTRKERKLRKKERMPGFQVAGGTCRRARLRAKNCLPVLPRAPKLSCRGDHAPGNSGEPHYGHDAKRYANNSFCFCQHAAIYAQRLCYFTPASFPLPTFRSLSTSRFQNSWDRSI